jgi:endonuclease G
MNVNIIQHPLGLPKMIAIRNNYLTARTDRTLLYETDTQEGSSGSPVFNDTWDIVALHHWGEPFLEKTDDRGDPIPVTVNEGVRISAIYNNLSAQRASLPSNQQPLLDEALSFAQQASVSTGRLLSPPRPGRNGAARSEASVATVKRTPVMSNASEVRLVVPVEIVVRVGNPSSDGAVVSATTATAAVQPSTKSLTRRAESVQIDDDFSNRKGYDPRFIPGENLPLPELSASLKKQIAPLRAGEPNADEGELKYEHFSLKMSKSKHLAIFTATNIDGKKYLEVNRATGEVSNGSEGDRWFKDPRISESFWTGQDFYDSGSIYFDRGHLTRRNDPTWGTVAQAERANADTFHFTNCSPQHFRFNQSAKYWQGAERYVLENGILDGDDDRKRIVVFQGPIFDDTVDQFADNLQIPSSFFKVIVWKGATMKAVGLVVDQGPLLNEKRVGLGKPQDLPSVDVRHWRVGIKQMAKRAGLSFGTTVEDADTIGSVAQPHVGEEAAIPVKSFEDLLR